MKAQTTTSTFTIRTLGTMLVSLSLFAGVLAGCSTGTVDIDNEKEISNLDDIDKEIGSIEELEKDPHVKGHKQELSNHRNTRKRPFEKLELDTIEPTAKRSPKILDPKIHKRETRYPLFAEMPQAQHGEKREDALVVIDKFKVVDGKIDVSKAPAKYREGIERTWKRIAYIIPPKQLKEVREFIAWKGYGMGSIGGPPGKVEWFMSTETVGNMDHIIVHELGHQLSTTPEQLKEGSTYLKFLDTFHGKNSVLPEGTGKEFYDHYVTAYAATMDDEDFAETFRYFVWLDKPTSNDKPVDKKILMLWEDPLYRDARTHIRKQLGMKP